MEQLKRLDFIKSKLEEATRNIKSATKSGLPMEQNIPGFESFSIGIRDVQNQLNRTEHGDKKQPSYDMPGDCNSIDIDFILKDSLRRIRTHVYDGENMHKAKSIRDLHEGRKQQFLSYSRTYSAKDFKAIR